MIISMKPLSLAEVKDYLGKAEENKPLNDYIKEYCKLTPEKSKALSEEIAGLKSIKIKEEHIVKLADFLPRDAEDVHKIFNDVSLDEAEVNAILDVVKNY